MSETNANRPELPPLLGSRDAYQERLNKILPKSITGVTSTANPAAAAIAFVAMYVGSIENENPIRPSTVTWMSDAIAAHREEHIRYAYYEAAVSKDGEKAVRQMCDIWEIDRGTPWYAGNSREQVRDESLKELRNNGAVLTATQIPTTSQRPRYTLEPGFASLLLPGLPEEELDEQIRVWQSTHLTPTGRRRAAIQNDPSRSADSVTVHLPDGGSRTLHAGPSSVILKALLEHFATKLDQPSLLFVSQPGEKVNLLDGQGLASMGLEVDQTRLLPDCLLADLATDRDTFWFIEVVASDGPITEERKHDLLQWATSQGLQEDRCRFLTAFRSRTASEAKRALPQLARGSYAWFSDEPDALLAWDDLNLT
ncbi:hypothetical protein F8568_020475 [Actinomadura sp. LD22]|uniref:Restriction endonuclease n=1 Tax=Actinomadura physcomitrii TaxID=2650748 RepID=A0A6I4M955_9ACTN|nr:BsuBI/PstI family type II restriction endonuclease [Actinomadura physcomitrii]MWA02708.1 hypothetical protein [Actinomadura physcomitrii]